MRRVRVEAVTILTKEMTQRAQKSPGSEIVPAVVRTGQILRNAVVGEGMPQGEPVLDRALVRDIGGFGGHVLAMARRWLDRGDLSAVAA